MFLLEFLLKVIAQGLYFGHNTYLGDPWNVLDGLVVVTALLSSFPGIPKLTALRVFRVLRPLKSISALPGLQKLVVTMLKSIPQLLSVVILLSFVFMLFGVMGTRLFAGKLHSRCRLTPYPVRETWEPGLSFEDYRCMEESNFNTAADQPSWTKASSPWAEAQPCWWPVDDELLRVCTFGSGRHTCFADTEELDEDDWRWCGSSFDALGNPRFSGETEIMSRFYSQQQLNSNGTYVESLNWGYTGFDNIVQAFLSIFQSITLEGWSEILYQVEDADTPLLGQLFFVVLILWGGLFTMNLLLAVLESNFTKSKKSMKLAEERQSQAAVWLPPEFAADSARAQKELQSSKVLVQEVVREVAKEPSKLRRLVENGWFRAFVTGLIVLNTTVLAMDHYPMSLKFERTLEMLNAVFTILFTAEMALKLAAHGIRGYAADNYNLFDGLIVVVSIIELVVSPPGFFGASSSGGQGGAYSALRSFRLFRVFKLAQQWKSMRQLLLALGKTLYDVANFGLLLVLFMYIGALVGLQFFANRLHFDENGYGIGIGEEGWADAEVPRSTFDSLELGITSIFQILSGENWNTLMYDTRRAVGWVSSLFYLILITLGMFVIINLFLAIVLSNLTSRDDEPPELLSDAAATPGSAATEDSGPWDEKDVGGQTSASKDPVEQALLTNQVEVGGPESVSSGWQRAKRVRSAGLKGEGFDSLWLSNRPPSMVSADEMESGEGKAGVGDEPEGDRSDWDGTRRVKQEMNSSRVLMVLGPTHPVRVKCFSLIQHEWFDKAVYIGIVICSIQLGMDSPLRDPSSLTYEILDILDTVLIGVFTAEMVAKVLAMGFAFMPGAYLRDAWNRFDFLIVVFSLIGLEIKIAGAASSGSANIFKGLKALRALRPLRMISRLPGLKLVVYCLYQAVPDIINVAAVCLLFFLIFATLGVNYFKGLLYSCQGAGYEALSAAQQLYLATPTAWASLSDEQRYLKSNAASTLPTHLIKLPSLQSGWFGDCGASPCCSAWPSNIDESPTSRQVCECLDLDWGETIPQQFNNVAQALLTFFEISTTEGWTTVMYACVDTTAMDMQPVRGNSTRFLWFFMLFITVGSYIVMNLFVGVIIDNFNRLKAKADAGPILMTESQAAWLKARGLSMRQKPRKKKKPPTTAVGKFCFRLISNSKFDNFVMACIALNTIVIAMDHFGQSDAMRRFGETANAVFGSLFALEALVKIIVLKGAYFKDKWNRFDFFIVVGTEVGLILQFSTSYEYGSVATLMRTFRLGRILRLVRGFQGLAQIFNTLLVTLPSLGNVGALLFLLFFIYAVLGVQICWPPLFAQVHLVGSVNESANFQRVWGSMLLLLRFSTGEDWNRFMHDMSTSLPGCVADPPYDPDVCGFSSSPGCTPLNGCGSRAIYPFLISFTFTVTFVFLNLLIGIILDGFQTASKSSEEPITRKDYERFGELWSSIDTEATGYIPAAELPDFLKALGPPLGFGLMNYLSEWHLAQQIVALNIPMFPGEVVRFKDLLLALAERVHAKKTGGTHQVSQDKWILLQPPKQSSTLFGASSSWEAEDHDGDYGGLEAVLAARHIQVTYREYQQRQWQAKDKVPE
ncbi:unnamed protein product [Chrysoparadoxa australica]